MKKVWGYSILLASAVMISACDDTKKSEPVSNTPSTAIQTPIQTPTTPIDPSKQSLMHHRFVLVKFNDQNITAEKQQAFIEFGENFTVNGKMCNRFFGQATLEDDVIKSSDIAMTKMICGDDEQLNQLDSVISELFRNGATVYLDNNTLKLENDSSQLIFVLKDLM